VPDNNVTGAASTIPVAGFAANCLITNITVTVNLAHTRVGDMVMVLKGPNGMVINLDYRLSATGSAATTTGFINTQFSSAGVQPLSAGINPFSSIFKADAAGASGVFGPTGPAGFNPTTVGWFNMYSILNGGWTLGVYDGATGETGTLQSWCIAFYTTCQPNIYPSSPVVWSPAAGLYLDAASTIPYVAGTASNTVYARPIVAGTYTYNATVQNLPAAAVAFSNTAAINIPVGGTAAAYPATVNVTGLPATGIRVASVVVNNFSHTKVEDIDIALVSPAGQTVLLMSDVGGSGAAANVTYTFKDNAPAMQSATLNATGIYRPSNFNIPDAFPAPGPGALSQSAPTLTQFNGNFNGTWQLFVIDDDGSAGQGSIADGYTIYFDTTTYCTSAATLVNVIVSVPTNITTQPVNQNICVGSSATFTVTATGSTLAYQWQLSTNGGTTWTNIINAGVYNGVNNAALTITNPPLSMSGQQYRVIINNGAACAAAASQPATLTVNPLPGVSFYPHPYHLLLPGLSTTLSSVVVPGPAASYTWFHNGAVVPGATADTLQIDFSQIGLYQVSVTDVNGCTAISDTMSIRDSALGLVFIYPNPANGNFQVRMYSAPNTATPRSIVVYNSMGNKVTAVNYNQTVSYQQVYIDVRRNGKGMYWVEVLDKDGKRISISKVMIQ
jgi:subtilisin-like proprotein convertase family protein